MTQYAFFDVTAPPPQPVLGWYDTGVFSYSNLPAAPDLLELTSDQWAARNSGIWAVSGGTLVPYTPPTPTPTLAQQALTLLYSGLVVTSSGDGALDAVYACDSTTQQQIVSEVTSILLNGTFADGTTTIEWPDITSTPGSLSVHAFSIDQFKALAAAVASFVTDCTRCITGQSTTLPSARKTIA